MNRVQRTLIHVRADVRFNSVHPAVVATPMIRDLLDRKGDVYGGLTAH